MKFDPHILDCGLICHIKCELNTTPCRKETTTSSPRLRIDIPAVSANMSELSALEKSFSAAYAMESQPGQSTAAKGSENTHAPLPDIDCNSPGLQALAKLYINLNPNFVAESRTSHSPMADVPKQTGNQQVGLALYDYFGEASDELSFRKGDVLRVEMTDESGDGWLSVCSDPAQRLPI
jgi:hypothetical protein